MTTILTDLEAELDAQAEWTGSELLNVSRKYHGRAVQEADQDSSYDLPKTRIEITTRVYAKLPAEV